MARTFDVAYRFIAINKFTAVGEKIRKNLVKLRSVLAQLPAKLRKAGAGFKRLAASIGKAGKKIKSFGKDFTMKVSAPLAAFGGIVLHQSAKMETFAVSFETMLRSADKGKKLMEGLTRFTATTPFQLEGVAKSTKILLAFGTLLKEITGRLRMLGDISSGVDAPLEDMAKIFGKIQGKGKLLAEEMNQLIERGVPIMTALTRKYGMTAAQVFKQASKGLLTFAMVDAALVGMTKQGGIFFESTLKQSKTLAGRWSTLIDNMKLIAAAIGDTIVEIFDLKGGMADLNDKLTDIPKKIAEFRKSHPILTKIVVIFGTFLIVLGPLIIGLGQLAITFVAIKVALMLMSAPLLLVLKAFALLAIAFTAGWQAGQLLRDIFPQIDLWATDFLESVINRITEFIDLLKSVWNWRQKLMNLGIEAGQTVRDVILGGGSDQNFGAANAAAMSAMGGGFNFNQTSSVGVDVTIRGPRDAVESVTTKSSGNVKVKTGRQMEGF